MKLFKRPVTNEGDIKYFEVFKIFLFVLFLFAVYTRVITQVEISNPYIMELIGFIFYVQVIYQVSYSLIHEIVVIVDVLVLMFKEFMGKLVPVQYLKEIMVQFIENLQDGFVKTFNRKSVYCVFRC